MVASQLRPNNVNDPAVVAAMDAVPREAFVPADRAVLAYIDVAVPLGEGRALNPPLATGRLLTEARLRAGEKLLIVGAATGYAAALAARLGAEVIALESSPTLLDSAHAGLAGSSATVVAGPLTAGWEKGAPYDVILIDGAIEQLPPAIVAQLKLGGRLVCGLIEGGVTRLAHGIRSGGGFSMLAFADADAVRLPGFETPSGFKF